MWGGRGAKHLRTAAQVLNGTGTSTSFVSPFHGSRVFTLKHSQHYMITLPAGLKHAAHPGSGVAGASDPRITQVIR